MGLPRTSFLARLTRDSETTYTPSGLAVCKLGLACSEKYKEKETKLFIDATAFGKTAEFIAAIHKGQRVFVTGKIQTEDWEDKQTGKRRYKTVMIIESFEYIEKRQDNQNNQFQNNTGFQGQGAGFQNNNQGFGQQSEDIPF